MNGIIADAIIDKLDVAYHEDKDSFEKECALWLHNLASTNITWRYLFNSWGCVYNNDTDFLKEILSRIYTESLESKYKYYSHEEDLKHDNLCYPWEEDQYPNSLYAPYQLKGEHATVKTPEGYAKLAIVKIEVVFGLVTNKLQQC